MDKCDPFLASPGGRMAVHRHGRAGSILTTEVASDGGAYRRVTGSTRHCASRHTRAKRSLMKHRKLFAAAASIAAIGCVAAATGSATPAPAQVAFAAITPYTTAHTGVLL